MYRAHLSSKVALDTTVVRNFHDAGYPTYLRQYLPQAVAVGDVQHELNWQARSRPNLQVLIRGWPALLEPLPSELVARGLDIQELWLEPDDDQTAHLGEIYTVLGASHFGIPLVITDDRGGRRLAAEERVPVIGSGELACEMVCQKSLRSQEDAWAIYRKSRKNPNREKFEALLARYRADA